MSHTHERVECADCGEVIRQCRCMEGGQNVVRLPGPCRLCQFKQRPVAVVRSPWEIKYEAAQSRIATLEAENAALRVKADELQTRNANLHAAKEIVIAEVAALRRNQVPSRP